MSAAVSVQTATLQRWLFVLARAAGSLAGAASAFEKSGFDMPELRNSEAECDTMRDEIRTLIVSEIAALLPIETKESADG